MISELFGCVQRGRLAKETPIRNERKKDIGEFVNIPESRYANLWQIGPEIAVRILARQQRLEHMTAERQQLLILRVRSKTSQPLKGFPHSDIESRLAFLFLERPQKVVVPVEREQVSAPGQLVALPEPPSKGHCADR